MKKFVNRFIVWVGQRFNRKKSEDHRITHLTTHYSEFWVNKKAGRRSDPPVCNS